MENAQIAGILDEIADLLELTRANRFRIRSYRSAAQTVRGLSQRLADRVSENGDLEKLPNIGESTADKIAEIVGTGSCRRVEKLRQKVPHGLVEMLRVPRIGPRTAMFLHKRLDIDSVPQLKKACERHRVRELKGMGRKTEENILKGIKAWQTTSGRSLLKDAAETVTSLGNHLDRYGGIQHWQVVGSFRRGCETVGDLDFLVQAKDRKRATSNILKYTEVDEVTSRGEERVSVRLRSGMQVDFRFFNSSSTGAALLYFTGSKAHTITLRKIAQKHDWKLNEYGLFKGKRRIAGKTEKAAYHKLGLNWIPPELRENRGEVDHAKKHKAPRLIELEDIRGDLHCHTKATDGGNTIQQMARAAKDRGYDYIAITDHSKAVRVAGGLNDSQLRRHADAIRKANDELKGLTLLAGVEVDILKSGKLDLKDETLADLDWVIASVHSHFKLNQREMTQRLVRAIESGVVHCLGHPLGRVIGRRNPIRIDADKIFAACRKHHVLLEINSQPDRLDLPDSFCQAAQEAGVEFVIDTDAHRTSEFDLIRFGVTTARRGWVTKHHVLNALSISTLRKRLKRA